MDRKQLTTFAYAKINLGLAIISRRDDGYHELQSVMQSIGLHDRVNVSLTESGIQCLCGHLSGPDNLAYRAAQLFLDGRNLIKGIRIEIEKSIPIQAGLAGGSSDAAATLRALNRLFEEPYSQEELLRLAGQLGADVAFCLEGGTQWATGIGELLERLPSSPLMDLIVIKPPQGVNTAKAYRVFDEEGKSHPLDLEAWKESLASGEVERIIPLLSNDLELASMKILPMIAEIKNQLLEAGCLTALMSGSGSAVFGVVGSKAQAEDLADQFRKRDYQVWVTQTIERGDLKWEEN